MIMAPAAALDRQRQRRRDYRAASQFQSEGQINLEAEATLNTDGAASPLGGGAGRRALRAHLYLSR